MKRTQKQQILNHLIKHGSIQPMEALRRYGVMRLASRINEIRMVYPVYTKIVTTKAGKRYARYILGGIAREILLKRNARGAK